MESASSRPGAGGDLPCGFCPSLRAPYTCPRCLLRFCSVPCFHGHGSCARDFRERELRLRLQGLRGDEASRGRLREALLRLRELREPGDEQAGVGLGPEEGPLWEQLTPEEQEAFRKLLGSGGAASLVPLWTPWWEAPAAPPALVREVGPPRPPPAAGGRPPRQEGDPRDPLEEGEPQRVLGGKSCDPTEEADPQNPLQGGIHYKALIEEMDPQEPLGGKESHLIAETDLKETLEREETDLITQMDPRDPLPSVFMEKGGSQNASEVNGKAFVDKMDPLKLSGGGCDLTEPKDHRNPLQSAFVEEIDPQNPFEAGERDRVTQKDPRNPFEAGERDQIEQRGLQNPFKTESDRVEQKDPQNPLQVAFIGERDPPKPFLEPRDPQKPLQGAFIAKTDPRNPLEAGERAFVDGRGPQSPSEGEEEGTPNSLCGTEASRLLGAIPPAIPPLSSFRASVSPSAGFQLPGVLYGYVYSLSLYNGDVEEEDVLREFCETLLDVSPSLGSPHRAYGSVSEALQDASRSVTDRRYPECPLGPGGAMSAVAKLLSQKAFLLAALCHLGRLLRKGRKLMAEESDRSQAFRAGKKCAFLLSWANENEGQLPLLALAAWEEGRGQKEAGQEVGALRRGLERKWRGKRPPIQEKEKVLIEELN